MDIDKIIDQFVDDLEIILKNFDEPEEIHPGCPECPLETPQDCTLPVDALKCWTGYCSQICRIASLPNLRRYDESR